MKGSRKKVNAPWAQTLTPELTGSRFNFLNNIMTKFAKIKKCVSNMHKDQRFINGIYYCLFLISTTTLITYLIKGDNIIVSFILSLYTGLIAFSGIYKDYWPGKETDKTEE